MLIGLIMFIFFLLFCFLCILLVGYFYGCLLYIIVLVVVLFVGEIFINEY